jgi:pimeloyl-[acyl-carrier protein] methyl ester esterase
MLKRIVLLPGLDGTGQLFSAFVAALPKTITAAVAAYPPNKLLSYAKLLPLMRLVIPEFEPFVLLAESFSTPLAVDFAASNPSNLAALVICAGFVFKPLADCSAIAKAVADPWLFRLSVPRYILEYFLSGRDAPQPLVQDVRQVLKSVSPEVLSDRVCQALNCDARSAASFYPRQFARRFLCRPNEAHQAKHFSRPSRRTSLAFATRTRESGRNSFHLHSGIGASKRTFFSNVLNTNIGQN